MLWPISKNPEYYRPVYKIGNQGEWKRMDRPGMIIPKENEIELNFDFVFVDN